MVTVEELIRLLEEQFEEFEQGVLKPGTHFADVIEWSSMNGLYLIALIKNEYNIMLKSDELKQCVSPNDLAVIINEKAA